METILEQCKIQASDALIYGKISELFHLVDSKTMLLQTREVIQEVKKDPSLLSSQLVLNSFAHIFFKKDYSGSKVVTVRRLLSIFFNSLSKEAQTPLIQTFQELTLVTIRNKVSSETSPLKIRQNVDILASLFENFHLGEDCVKITVIPYLSYLIDAHNQFIRLTNDASSPVELNEAMYNCLVAEQLINRTIQKCFDALRMKFEEVEIGTNSMLGNLILTNVDILRNNDLVIDCRCNAGITLTFMFRICCPKYMCEILGEMLGKCEKSFDSGITLPDWLKETGLLQLNKETLSTTSYLCFLFGLLSMLNVDHLLHELSDDSFLLTDIFLKETLLLVQLVTNPAAKVILAKLINLWTTKANSLTHNDCTVNPKLRTQLIGGSDTVSNVLDYIWNALEDSLDVVRQNARLSFDQILKTHLKLCNHSIENDPFVSNLIRSVLEIPWCKRGKYAPLTCFVGSLGASRMLIACPNLTECVISQLDDQTVACYCSEFYEKLYQSHKTELDFENQENSTKWFKMWVNPIVDALCSSNKKTKTHILQYILPKLMSSSNNILQYMTTYLSNQWSTSKGTLGALIMCLSRGRSMGLLDDRKSDSYMWCGVVQVSVLKYALSALDEQIRLDAFSLLCENKKTTQAVKTVEFELVELFIPVNLNNQSPSFRQNVSAYTKKFLVRMKDSENSLIRQLKKAKNETEISRLKDNLLEYGHFLTWLQNQLFAGLYCGAAFATRTSCLRILSYMIDVLEKNEDNKDDRSFLFFKNFQQSHVYTLLECIADTFEENKIDAMKIFESYLKSLQTPSFNTEQLKELCKTCMSLTVSVRPQDSTVSAYLARCLLKIDGISQVINPYGLELKAEDARKTFVPSESDSSYLSFLDILILSLQDQTEVAKKRLIIAAANRPIYPTIHCIRYILYDVNLKSKSDSVAWKELVGKLVKACLDVATVVSPVVQDSSPEGNVPSEAIRGPGLDFSMVYENAEDRQLLLDAEESEKTVTLMPEYLVVCCWRSIKEVSLLLGEITNKASMADTDGNKEGLLSFNQVMEIGDYFINQLLSSLHRGAFELAYAGYVMMCERLWISPIRKLHQLPKIWLEKLMTDITADDGNSGLCSTRRSAGIPFFVKALLITEPPANEQTCFNQAMTKLLELSDCKCSTSATDNPPKVHALNILRVLFKDNKLGNFVAPYISDGLRAAILGFKSNYWSVRNSSTLLLSAMMVRIFGVKVSKHDFELSRKNCLTGRAFFHRFPKVYNFLLREFEAATDDCESMDGLQLHPSLYPVLMVLGRLFPSAMEGADSNLNLAAFIPSVMRCASSPVFKTRIMAARAIQPLVEKDRLEVILIELFDILPQNNQVGLGHSHIHGVLLQIKFLLESVEELSSSVQDTVAKRLSNILMTYSWVLSIDNRCPLTLEVAFEVWDKVFSLKCETYVDLTENPIYQYYCECLRCIIKTGMSGSPGSENCMVLLTKLALKYLHPKKPETDQGSHVLYIQLLNSDSYEVRLAVLDEILSVLDPPSSKYSSEIDDKGDTRMLQLLINGSKEILRHLFTMAIYKEWHFECIERVFEVLSLFPNCIEKIPALNFKNNETSTKPLTQKEIFLLCLKRLSVDGRVAINCAIIHFMSRFMPHLYEFTIISSAEFGIIASSWCRVLQQFSSTEKDADLQLAVTQVLLNNAEILLVDPKNSLKDTSLEFWNVLFNLLQEDDLDVKEVASKILCQLDTTHQGDVQPACALDQLLQKMVDIYWPKNPGKVIVMLLGLVRGTFSHSQYHTDERLFDKGEMNTYRDELHFACLTSQYLKLSLQKLNAEIKISGSNVTDLEMDINGFEADSLKDECSLKATIQILKKAFCETSRELNGRLAHANSWSLSTLFQDGSSYSISFNELCRSLLFLQCYEESNVKSDAPHVHIIPLSRKCQTLLENSCVNYCLSNI